MEAKGGFKSVILYLLGGLLMDFFLLGAAAIVVMKLVGFPQYYLVLLSIALIAEYAAGYFLARSTLGQWLMGLQATKGEDGKWTIVRETAIAARSTPAILILGLIEAYWINQLAKMLTGVYGDTVLILFNQKLTGAATYGPYLAFIIVGAIALVCLLRFKSFATILYLVYQTISTLNYFISYSALQTYNREEMARITTEYGGQVGQQSNVNADLMVWFLLALSLSYLIVAAAVLIRFRKNFGKDFKPSVEDNSTVAA